MSSTALTGTSETRARLLRIATISLVTGGVVHLLIAGFALRPEILFWSLAVALIYTTALYPAQEWAMRRSALRGPITGRGDVLRRVALHLAAMFVAFVVATALVELLPGISLLQARGLLGVVALVALSATALASGAFYLALYYNRARAAEELATRSELAALRAQINPHFLFNALNSIAALIRSDPVSAERVTESLADLFRYSLRASTRPMVTLREELEAVDLYIEIEQARFGERLLYLADIPEELASTPMPSLILQPLVENAVRHGVGRSERPVAVRVGAERSGDRLRLTVTDDGPAFPSQELDRLTERGTGLGNVRDRLRGEYGESGRITIDGKSVIISIPC